tara:strand:- start:703 stop:1110 length:408 start_codon:yes stop_codon:yes gene_type:complete
MLIGNLKRVREWGAISKVICTRRGIAGLLIALLLATAPGCLGRFALSKSVADFNLAVVDEKWPREAVFLGMYIVPVYPISGMIDLFIINSIEFWTDENPVDGKPSAVLSKADEDETPGQAESGGDVIAVRVQNSP